MDHDAVRLIFNKTTPLVIPAQAETQQEMEPSPRDDLVFPVWFPAFAGMTQMENFNVT